MLPQVQQGARRNAGLLHFLSELSLNTSRTAVVLLCRGLGGGFEAHVTLRLGNYPFRAWCYHLGWLVLQHWVGTASRRRPTQPSGCSGHAVCPAQHQVQFGLFLSSSLK